MWLAVVGRRGGGGCGIDSDELRRYKTIRWPPRIVNEEGEDVLSLWEVDRYIVSGGCSDG